MNVGWHAIQRVPEFEFEAASAFCERSVVSQSTAKHEIGRFQRASNVAPLKQIIDVLNALGRSADDPINSHVALEFLVVPLRKRLRKCISYPLTMGRDDRQLQWRFGLNAISRRLLRRFTPCQECKTDRHNNKTARGPVPSYPVSSSEIIHKVAHIE